MASNVNKKVSLVIPAVAETNMLWLVYQLSTVFRANFVSKVRVCFIYESLHA